jgi:hypothetical protein
VRSPRIELGTPTWKEGVLPLNYDRDEYVEEIHHARESVKLWVDVGLDMNDFYQGIFTESSWEWDCATVGRCFSF